MKATFIIAITLLLLIAGCAQKTIIQKPTADDATASETITDVESGIDEVDALDSDLNFSETDDIDSELDQVDW
jgi:type IV pilus biogenesis protein CpaD/CtpE